MTATCPASSRSAATASPTRGGSSSWRPSPSASSWRLRRRHPRPDPAVLGRRLRLLHAPQIGMVKHWRSGRRSGWRWRMAVNAFGAVLTAVVLVVVVVREVRRRRLPRRHPHPAPRRDDAVHQPPVRRGRAASSRSSRNSSSSRRTARSGSSSRSPASTVPSSRPINVARSIADDVRAVYISDDPEEARADTRATGSARCPGVPLVVVESPYRALSGRCSPTSTSSTRPGRPASRSRSRSWSSPSTSLAAGGSGSSTTSPPKRLRTALLGRPHTVVVNVPYRREERAFAEPAPAGCRRGRAESGAAVSSPRACQSRAPAPPPTIRHRTVRVQCRPRPSRSSDVPSSDSRRSERRANGPDRSPAGEADKAELIGVHVVEIDWTLPLDADVAGRSEEIQRVLDVAEAAAENVGVQDRARPPPGARRRRGARRRGDRARRRPACRRAALPDEVRRRLCDRPDHSLCSEERTVCSLGRPGADPGGAQRESSHRRLRSGRRGARRRLRSGRPRRRSSSTSSTPAFDRLPSTFKGTPSAAMARTKTRSAGPAPKAPTCSWP